MESISASQFKARCLALMDDVAKTREALIITKHGKPVAKLVPFGGNGQPLFGLHRNQASEFPLELIAPLDEPWSAESGELL